MSNSAVDVAFRGEASVELDASTSRDRARNELPISGVTLEEDWLVGAIDDGDRRLVHRHVQWRNYYPASPPDRR